MNEVPAMHIELIQTDNHPTGAGQMATPLVAPAISSVDAAQANPACRSNSIGLI
jgi:isoquinoline 1-oxidoreductase beta subunit